MKLLTHLYRKYITSPTKKFLFWITVPIISFLLLPFIIGFSLTYVAWTKIQSKSVKLATAFALATITFLIGSSWVLGFFWKMERILIN
ncbi:hypothetical protein KKB83_00910 [Patescibacteria group bacterium]|nr:hypothetical protein [Patescibacteria group bacterium]